MAESSIRCDGTTACITCSDAADVWRLERIDGDRGIGWCIDENGNRCEVLLALVPDAHVGEDLLVHAGAALLVAGMSSRTTQAGAEGASR